MPLEPEQQDSFVQSFLWPVLSAALLITGNTFGAGCLVLPELAQQTGLGTFSGLFVAAFALNLFSGLVLSDVAIRQKEQSNDVPSSFQEFANANVPALATPISGLSLLVNSCVLTFDLSQVGGLGQEWLGLPHAELVWVSLLGLAFYTLPKSSLSNAASLSVSVLFASLGTLLIPGLQSVEDPVGLFLAQGEGLDWSASVSEAAPVVLMAMVFQNST